MTLSDSPLYNIMHVAIDSPASDMLIIFLQSGLDNALLFSWSMQLMLPSLFPFLYVPPYTTFHACACV
jgi:hypothetical protein